MLKNIFHICLVVCAGNTLIGASREALIEGAAMARGAAAAEARIAAQRMARPTYALPIRPTTGPASTSSRIPAPSILGHSAATTSGVAARVTPPLQASQQRGLFGFFEDNGRTEFEEKIKKQGYVGQQDIDPANKYLKEIINKRSKAMALTMLKSSLKTVDETRASDEDLIKVFDPYLTVDDIEPFYLGLLSNTGAPHLLKSGLQSINMIIQDRKKKNIHPGHRFEKWLDQKVENYLGKATQAYSSAIAKNALALSLLKEAALNDYHNSSIRNILIDQAVKIAGNDISLVLLELTGQFMLGGLRSDIYDHYVLENLKEKLYRSRARSQQQQSQNSDQRQQKKNQQEQSQESQRQNRQQSTQSAPPARPYSELARMKIGEMHRFITSNTGRGPWIILGLDPQTASKESVKKARRTLALKFHPDNAEQEDAQRANEVTAAINAAYEQAMQEVPA